VDVRRVQPGVMLEAGRFVLGAEQTGSGRESVSFSEKEQEPQPQTKRAAASD